ncbi:MAG: glycosyltransferase [Frankiaceae bacterium]
MRVVGFGTYDARAHPRVGILLDGLRAAGHQVIEVNVPLGLDTAARVAMLHAPHLVGRLAVRLFRCWLTLILRSRRLLRGAPPDVVLVGYLGHFDVLLARRLFPGTPIVLDHLISAADTAVDRGETGSGKGKALRALDRAALQAADLVLVDTAEHAALVPRPYRGKALVVPVGAPQRWWAARSTRPRRTRGEPLRVVFFGLFTPLQGAPVVGEALGLLADFPAVAASMIGSGQDWAATRTVAAGNPRVEWRAWVAPENLPAVVAEADVCLGIFGTSAKAQRVVPNKVFQGAAAGCAIVTADTPPQRRILGDAALFVPPGNPPALAAMLQRLAADPAMSAYYRTAAADLADAAFRPATVVRPLLDRLPDLVGTPR